MDPLEAGNKQTKDLNVELRKDSLFCSGDEHTFMTVEYQTIIDISVDLPSAMKIIKDLLATSGHRSIRKLREKIRSMSMRTLNAFGQ